MPMRAVRWTSKHYNLLAYLVMFLAIGFLIIEVREITADTNSKLTVGVQEKDAQIAQLSYVLNDQAAPAVVHLLKLCQREELACPAVLLSPSEPTFAEQLAEQQANGGG